MATSIGKFDVRAAFTESRQDDKEAKVFEKEAKKTIGERIKGLFAVVCAQTKNMTPGDDNKQDLGALWIQTAGVIAQMMNSENIERNTTIQKESYKLGMIGLIGHTYEGQRDKVKFDGTNPVTIRTDVAPADSQGRLFQVISTGGATLRSIIMQPDDKEVTWNGKDDKDQTLNAGSYNIRVVSLNEKNEQIIQPAFVKCEIDAVGYDRDDLPYLMEDGKIVTEVNKWTKPTFIKNI